MNDITHKINTLRTANAIGFIQCNEEIINRIKMNTLPKGDLFNVTKADFFEKGPWHLQFWKRLCLSHTSLDADKPFSSVPSFDVIWINLPSLLLACRLLIVSSLFSLFSSVSFPLLRSVVHCKLHYTYLRQNGLAFAEQNDPTSFPSAAESSIHQEHDHVF